MSEYVLVSALPFWRWAVAIDERPDLPAIPFYREAPARALAAACAELFPHRTVCVLKRTLRGVVAT